MAITLQEALVRASRPAPKPANCHRPGYTDVMCFAPAAS